MNIKKFVPLVVGITGHRDIDEKLYEPLKNSICSILNGLKTNYQNTPIILLTPLAEGADRIAAKSAIECGVEYIVPLPMEAAEYEKDFKDTQSVNEFRELLEGANDCFTVVRKISNNTREKLYEAAGVFIVKHCHILIALWDGEASDRIGGTSMMVDFKLKGIPNEYVINRRKLDYKDDGAVYHILTPRMSNPNVITDYVPHKIYPVFWNETGDAENEYNKIFKQMDEFNEDVKKHSEGMENCIKESVTQILPEGGQYLSSLKGKTKGSLKKQARKH